jgi:Na+-driven multidrug efflux pump
MVLSGYSMVSRFLLAALLFSHKKVSGVQCFASGTSASRSKCIPKADATTCTTHHLRLHGNGIHRQRHDALLQSNHYNQQKSLFSQQKCEQKNYGIARRMASISSSGAEFEKDDFDDDPKLKSDTRTSQINNMRGGGGGDDAAAVAALSKKSEQVKAWPCGDALDRKLIKIALPCIANFAINPLVGAVDLFWINRMGNTLAVAGQAAANQIFSSAFWLTSFLPSVTATLVAKEHAKGSEEGVQDAVSQALIVGTMVALFGSAVVLSRPDRLLGGVLKSGAPAREFARPYLLIRGFAFLPSLLSLIGFSSFRGEL